MPGRSKTTSTAIAGLVVAAAATVTSLWSGAGAPATTDGSAPVAATSTPTASRVGPTQAAAGDPPSSGDARSARSRTEGEGSVLFLGRSATLNPRGGVTKSFACRAAASVHWSCVVREGATPVVPASVAPDAVVVAMAPADDAARVRRLLDRLPPGAAGARTLILAPVAVTSDTAAARRLAAVRQLARTRGAVLVDPVTERWVTARTAGTYLAPGGDQLTAAGHAYVATRLAGVLRSSQPR